MLTTVRSEDNGPPPLAPPYLQLEQQMIPPGPGPIFSSFRALLFLWRFSVASPLGLEVGGAGAGAGAGGNPMSSSSF